MISFGKTSQRVRVLSAYVDGGVRELVSLGGGALGTVVDIPNNSDDPAWVRLDERRPEQDQVHPFPVDSERGCEVFAAPEDCVEAPDAQALGAAAAAETMPEVPDPIAVRLDAHRDELLDEMKERLVDLFNLWLALHRPADQPVIASDVVVKRSGSGWSAGLRRPSLEDWTGVHDASPFDALLRLRAWLEVELGEKQVAVREARIDLLWLSAITALRAATHTGEADDLANARHDSASLASVLNAMNAVLAYCALAESPKEYERNLATLDRLWPLYAALRAKASLPEGPAHAVEGLGRAFVVREALYQARERRGPLADQPLTAEEIAAMRAWAESSPTCPPGAVFVLRLLAEREPRAPGVRAPTDIGPDDIVQHELVGVPIAVYVLIRSLFLELSTDLRERVPVELARLLFEGLGYTDRATQARAVEKLIPLVRAQLAAQQGGGT